MVPGMHLNMSVSRDGINVFQDAKDEYGLSKEAYCFIGGIMKHMKATDVYHESKYQFLQTSDPGI